MSEEPSTPVQAPAIVEDEAHTVVRKLLAAHDTWFDVCKDYTYAGKTFDGYAEFRSTGVKYVLSKKRQLWQVDTFEYLFFQTEEHLTAQLLNQYVDFMTTQAIGKVNPDPNHMSSYLSLVLIANSCDADVEKLVRKTSWRKNFKWGFRGWADLRLCVIDLNTRTVLSNAAGKQIKPTMEANAGFAKQQNA